MVGHIGEDTLQQNATLSSFDGFGLPNLVLFWGFSFGSLLLISANFPFQSSFDLSAKAIGAHSMVLSQGTQTLLSRWPGINGGRGGNLAGKGACSAAKEFLKFHTAAKFNNKP